MLFKLTVAVLTNHHHHHHHHHWRTCSILQRRSHSHY